MKKRVLLLLFVFVFFSSNVFALSRLEELEALEREQARKIAEIEARKQEQEAKKYAIDSQYNEISYAIAENNSTLQTIFNSVNILEQEISDMELEVEGLEAQIAEKNIEIDKVKYELEGVRKEKDDLKRLATLRIKSIYENGEPSLFEILLQSSSISDFFNRVEYIEKLVESDTRLFDNLDKIESENVAIESTLEIAEDTLSDIVSNKKQKLEELDRKVAAKNLEMENVQNILAEQREKQEEVDALRQDAISALWAIQEDAESLDREMNQILEAKQAEINRASGINFTGGSFIWPLSNYSNLSSVFGWRTVFGISQYHKGIDIPAPGGTPIKAAGSGKVIASISQTTGYGEHVIIAHGDGYITLYGHMSRRLVSEGDLVQAGQVIGEVGTTGWSSGNHLHFGIKLNGEWVNPLNYY